MLIIVNATEDHSSFAILPNLLELLSHTVNLLGFIWNYYRVIRPRKVDIVYNAQTSGINYVLQEVIIANADLYILCTVYSFLQ